MKRTFILSVLLFFLFESTSGQIQGIVIQEVLYNPAAGISKKIAFKNTSTNTIDVSNWCLCNRPAYRTIGTTSAFSVLSGNPSALAPNDVLIIELTGTGFDFGTANSELALYHNNGCSGFGTAANLEDFVQWGAVNGSSRQNEASTAGLWTINSYVPSAAQGEIMVFDGINGNDGSSNLTLASDFANNTSGILPVELIEFNVTALSDRIRLEWLTAREVNSEYFTIERSLDGMRFEEITMIQAAGNSTEEQRYEYSDFDLFSDLTVYYRLKQIDFDGTLFCSSVKAINVKTPDPFPSILYPNPISHKECMTIKLGSHLQFEEMDVVIYDLVGRPVLSKSFEDLIAFGYEIFIDFPGLLPGNYQVTVLHKGQVKESLSLILY